jgi:hypothetical protein
MHSFVTHKRIKSYKGISRAKAALSFAVELVELILQALNIFFDQTRGTPRAVGFFQLRNI